MSIRATYAIDEQTSRRIKRLASDWNVSQAEVIRRSVQQADEASSTRLTPAEVVAHYARNPLPRDKAQTRHAIQSLRTMRHADDQRRLPATK